MAKDKKDVVQPIEAAGFDSRPAANDRTESGLTKKQLAYVINQLRNPEKTKTANAREAGLSRPPEKAAMKRIIGKLGPVLQEAGVGEESIANVFKDALEANKVVKTGRNSYDEVPDHNIRLAAASKLLDAAGYSKAASDEKGDINKVNNLFVNMNFSQIEQAEGTLKLITEVAKTDE